MVEIREIPLEGKGLQVRSGQKECTDLQRKSQPTLTSGTAMPATLAAVGQAVSSKQGDSLKFSTQPNVFTYSVLDAFCLKKFFQRMIIII